MQTVSADRSCPLTDPLRNIGKKIKHRRALTLSGGGFRATLFHLGVIRFLCNAGLLTTISHVCSVSGGSILAAHLVQNWSQYSNKATFDSIAAKLLSFISRDVRGRVIRRWIRSGFTLYPIIAGSTYSCITLLEKEYEELYGKKTKLSDLANPDVEIHILATSLTTASLCSFTSTGCCFDDGMEINKLNLASAPIPFPVSASSAFPPLFPPAVLSRKRWPHVRAEDLPRNECLADGGIFENLGIYHLSRICDLSNEPFQYALVSDASGRVDWDVNSKFSWLPGRAIRSSDILMKRVSDLEFTNRLRGPGTEGLIYVTLQENITEQDDPYALPIETQEALRQIRTDLDVFSPLEIDLLLRQGYIAARQAWVKQTKGLYSKPLPQLMNRTCLDDAPIGINAILIKEKDRDNFQRGKSSINRWRIFNFRSWDTWITIMTLMLISAAFAIFGYPYFKQPTVVQKESRTYYLMQIRKVDIVPFPNPGLYQVIITLNQPAPRNSKNIELPLGNEWISFQLYPDPLARDDINLSSGSSRFMIIWQETQLNAKPERAEGIVARLPTVEGMP
jgi:predicted acylesterase/phospholipase RssA